jgi:DNA-directed RNA polymerase specialized sigma24 family protein
MYSEETWERARRQITGWLRRHRDPWTDSWRDDLVQESVVAAWQWSERPHAPECFWAAVRTITRRARLRQLWRWHRRGAAFDVFVRERPDGALPERCFRIAGRVVKTSWVVPLLRLALQQLPPMDRQLLVDLAAGFPATELAERHARTPECIRTRACRARRRLRAELEACVRAADGFDL